MNNPRIERDIKLFRGFILFLAAVMLVMAYDFWSEESCRVIEGAMLGQLKPLCEMWGIKSISGIFVAFAVYLVYFAFSDKVRKRVLRDYT